MSKQKCYFCKKELTSKRNYDNHLLICKYKKDHDLTVRQEENNQLQEENKRLKQTLCDKEEQINFLKSLLENKNAPSTTIINNYKPTNSTNTINNNNVNLKLSNIDPVDFEEMKEMFEKQFCSKYIDKGLEGLANFLCDVPCKNKIVTTDFARKLVKYKNPDNQVVDDPKANILLKTAIKQNADTIIDKAEDRYQYWQQQIKDAREEDIEPDESDIKHRNHTKKLKTIATKAKNNLSIKLEEATNIILMNGMENKNNICAIE